MRANVFYRQNVDFLAGPTPGSIIPRRYGASIGYGKEFDGFGDLLEGKKNRTKITDSSVNLKKDTTGTDGP